MPKYNFVMSETDTYRAYFEAENIDQAKELLVKVNTCEIDTTDLPKFEKFGRDYEQEIAIDTLEEN
jgi:hypothetical protein